MLSQLVMFEFVNRLGESSQLCINRASAQSPAYALGGNYHIGTAVFK